MHNPSAPQVKVREPDWSESNTDIVHLNTANFDAVLKDAASVLVMFYAPCKFLVVPKDRVVGKILVAKSSRERVSASVLFSRYRVFTN